MAFSRKLGLVVALGTSWVAGAACSDDTTSGSPEAGTDAASGGSGATGNGGRAGGSGGSAGSGARGGRGGAGAPSGGGMAGNAGRGAGGLDAGTGGASGSDASTDASIGTGGAPVIPDASADGSGPEAGREASTGPAAAKQCAYACQTDDDCKVGNDESQKCDPVKKRCSDPFDVCTTNDDCVPFASIWLFTCTGDGDCLLPGDVCIDVGGKGFCATPPDVDFGCFPQEAVEQRRFSDGGTVTVCGDTSGRCKQGHCFIGCTSQAGCSGDNGTSCNESTGLCECAVSEDCTAAGVSTCNATTHQCACVDSTDCTREGKDSCVSGTCGCSSADACPDSPYKNATAVCE